MFIIYIVYTTLWYICVYTILAKIYMYIYINMYDIYINMCICIYFSDVIDAGMMLPGG